jgi:predicted nuclease of predicted toxin-antitoxin system
MRIKLDENLPAELVDDLRAAGHDADSVESEHLAGEPDLIVADAARRTRRVLFTLDKGLGDARIFPPSQHQGIVLFRLRTSGRAGVRRGIMAALPKLVRHRSLAGRLVVVTESSIRLRS